jgi:uncharacterized protein
MEPETLKSLPLYSATQKQQATVHSATPPGPSTPPIRLVLDTNVALDVLAFQDTRCDALAGVLRSGEALWFASAHMRAELERVLRRPMLARHAFDAADVLDQFDRLTVPSAPGPSHPRLRCRDTDDQPFLDLALAAAASALITHDRDLLVLAARARAFGLTIQTPANWTRTRG